MINNKSHLTAIKRNKLSAPATWLLTNGFFKDAKQILDYGCGRGSDTTFLTKTGFKCYPYDPHYQPLPAPPNFFDKAMCNFVLNVVNETVADVIIKKIQAHLTPTGVAYLTVRRDVKKNGFTSKGTFQRNVALSLPVLRETNGFCIYKLDKYSSVVQTNCV